MGIAKSTTQDFIRAAKLVHGDKFDYSQVEYITSKTPVTIICREHGTFAQTPNNHLRGAGCRTCRSFSDRLTVEAFIGRSRLKHGDKYDYSMVNYTTAEVKVSIVCPSHGVFEQTPHSHMKGQGCPTCARTKVTDSNRNGVDDFVRRARVVHGDTYSYRKVEYSTMQESVVISCKHGDFEITPESHLRKRGCPTCTFIEKSRKVHGNEYDYSLVRYKDAHRQVLIICPIHGVFKQRPSDHVNTGSGCSKCVGSVSRPEDEIFSLLDGEGLYVKQSVRGVLSNPRFELDLVIPSHKIAIEFCGLYWHSSKFAKSDYTTRHLDKLEMCNVIGYRLLTIFEDEWRDRRSQVTSKLLSIFGLNSASRIFARKTIVVNVGKVERATFLNANHIQGESSATVSYGLMFDGELVAVMCFKRLKPANYDLVRFATSKHVIGAFSKLFKHFAKNNEWESVISFADRRWSVGGVYEKNGFTHVYNTRPDYRYVKGGKRIHKFNFRHSNSGLLKAVGVENYDPNLSEFELMTKAGIHHIYDCGLSKYVILNNSPREIL